MGIENAKIHYQLSITSCKKKTGKGIEVSTGALAVNTGEYTGRSPQDRYLVKDSITEDKVWWGKVNIPFELRLMLFIKKLPAIYPIRNYVRDSYVCADPNYRLNKWLQKLHGQTCFATICFIRTRR
jgi:phosphoenolpyruvate carboxykinase (ATP)